MKMLLNLLLVLLMLPACSQPSSSGGTKSGGAKPKVHIQEAVIAGQLEVVQQHIAAGTDINQKDAMSGSTPLISAATFGQSEIAQVLIEAGADLAIKNNDGATALHAAAFFGRVEVAKILIAANSDQTIRNNYGATPKESIMGSFAEMKPIYEMLKQQLGPLGLQLDMAELEKNRPIIVGLLD